MCGGGGGDFKQGQPNDAQHTQQFCKLSVVILTYGRYSRSLLRVYGCPQGNRLGKISSSNLQDEAPTPLPIVGPLFISSLLLHRFRVLLGAWRFGLFRCVYSSFHNRLDPIREPAFYWMFYFSFPVYPCLFHHT